eukprot:5786824-Prorocentrum_lima.AAC.1
MGWPLVWATTNWIQPHRSSIFCRHLFCSVDSTECLMFRLVVLSSWVVGWAGDCWAGACNGVSTQCNP